MPFPDRFYVNELDGSNGFTINGLHDNDWLGRSVSSAGDINGDGINDIIIGSLGVPDSNYTGAAYVIFGSSNGFNTVIRPTNLDGTNGFIINGEYPKDRFGSFVAGLGDVNNDGIDDVIVAAVAAPQGRNQGKSYVIFGKRSKFNAVINASELNGSNGFIIQSSIQDINVAASPTGLGDINADGIADIGIGVGSSNGAEVPGSAHIIFGSRLGFPPIFDLVNLNGTNGFTITDMGNVSGVRVASADDINADGINDIAIGATCWSICSSNSGKVYIIFGSRNSFPPILDVNSLSGGNGFSINSIAPSDLFGSSISGVGDINGDKVDDLLIGAPFAPNGNDLGAAYVLYGSNKTFSASLNISELNENNGFIIQADEPGGIFGVDVNSAGDINHDGYPDMIIGASQALNFTGISYIIYGQSENFPPAFNVSSLNGNNGFSIYGAGVGSSLGISVSEAGDINNDGVDDVIIGSYGNPNNSYIGSTYVLFGGPPIITPTVCQPFNDLAQLGIGSFMPTGFQLSGAQLNSQAGQRVSAGDINGDGKDDIIIGAFMANGKAGKVYVVFGNKSLTNLQDLDSIEPPVGIILNGSQPNSSLGLSLDSGDINGDGFADIIIGALGANNYSGETYVVFGSFNPTSINNLNDMQSSSGITLSGGAPVSQSGNVVATGDINNDGYDDILIGALTADDNLGKVYVVFGSSNPVSINNLDIISPPSGIMLSGSLPNSLTGDGLAAGDINSDGYLDIIIGAGGANANAGKVYIVYGSPSPVSIANLEAMTSTVGISLNGVEAASYLGNAVSSGDVNSDGFDDVIIGAAGSNNSTGKIYVVFGSANPINIYNLDTIIPAEGIIINGTLIGGGLGYAISSGDINSDGKTDIITGATRANQGYVIFGSNNLQTINSIDAISFTAGIILNGGYGALSVSVAAGDINGDGIDDVIMGAPGLNQTGGAYAVLGNKTPYMITNNTLTTTYVTNEPYVILDSGVIFNGQDSEISRAAIQISSNFNPAEDILKATKLSENINALFNTTTGTLELTGVSSAEDYQSALEYIAYTNIADNPNTLPRTITFQVDNSRVCGLSNQINQTLYINVTSATPSTTPVAPPTSSITPPAGLSSSSDVASNHLSSGMLAMLISLPVGLFILLLIGLGAYYQKKRSSESRYSFFNARRLEAIPEGGEELPLTSNSESLGGYRTT